MQDADLVELIKAFPGCLGVGTFAVSWNAGGAIVLLRRAFIADDAFVIFCPRERSQEVASSHGRFPSWISGSCCDPQRPRSVGRHAPQLVAESSVYEGGGCAHIDCGHGRD